MDEFAKLDGIGIANLIKQGELSTYDVVQYYIAQIHQLNPLLNAVVHTMFEEAQQVAKHVDYKTSPLAGVPTFIKDLNPVKGHPTTFGSHMLKDYIAKESDEIVKRFQNAGIIFLGKTNTAEFGFLPTTEPQLFGPTKNPWDASLSAGGSSGGAGAAVAAGLAPFAHGSDGGGSIRIPASACGLFGFKPSRGQVPYSDYVNHLSVNHAITKSVRDSAALLDVIQGRGRFDTYPGFKKEHSFLSSVNQPPKKLRIGVTYDWDEKVFVDDETKNSIRHTANLLQSLGHEVDYAAPSFQFEQFAEHFITVWLGSGSVVVKHLGSLAGKELSEEQIERLSFNVYQYGQKLTAFQYEEARIALQQEARKINSYYQSYDLLLSPVLNTTPVSIGFLQDQRDPIHDMLDNFTNYCSFTPIANVTGQPSMSVPLYWSSSNVPIGSMLTGRIGEDHLLFQVASQLERAQPWKKKHQELQRELKKEFLKKMIIGIYD
ncbi:amidase [Salirhabdus salicampi]|uniref:amidase n=1 Tax=Salirhabdus salicampi TaxID=476102 RepID=UPI0020C3C6BF|nr:amidase [Salirhabdus salicampi]MCP8615699.1 amidase [Salirhabdus salicampi]